MNNCVAVHLFSCVRKHKVLTGRINGSVHFCTGFAHLDNLRERMFVREEGTFAREEGHVRERTVREGRGNVREGSGNVREGGGARSRRTTNVREGRGDVREGRRNVREGRGDVRENATSRATVQDKLLPCCTACMVCSLVVDWVATALVPTSLV